MSYLPGCDPDCPCQAPRLYGGTLTVYSTAVRYRLEMTRRRGRVEWFRWVSA